MLLERQRGYEADTERLGAALAPQLRAGLVLFLHGELGAGKTTFVRGILRGLGYTGAVKSPTYTLVEPYQMGDLTIITSTCTGSTIRKSWNFSACAIILQAACLPGGVGRERRRRVAGSGCGHRDRATGGKARGAIHKPHGKRRNAVARSDDRHGWRKCGRPP